MAETKIKAGQFFGVIGHGTDGYFLMTNADGSMSWAEGGASGPSVTSVDYPGDDTAADPAGGQTVVLTGTNFGSSMTVSIGGTTAPSVAHDSSTQLTITTPAKAAGDYDIVVTNTVTGASGTFVNGISYNGIPTWTTAAGSLGTFESETTISTITLQATEPDGGTITFNITNGALPTGLSLTGANIDGTTTAESSTTLYSFTIEAIDDENQSTPRNFSITVNSTAITNYENFTINTYIGNGSTQSIEGKIGTAASFNSSSQGIVLPNDVIPNNDYTLSFWFQISNWVDSNNIFLPNRYGSTAFTANAAGQVIVFSRGTSSAIELNHTINFSSSTSWHNIIFSKSSTNGLVIYVDGVADYTDSNFTDDTSYYDGNNRYNAIGASWKSGSFLSGYNGKVDQVRILSKAISSSEVTTLYGENNASLTKSTTDIFDDGSGVALYEFEEGAKDTGGTNGYIGAGGVFNGSSSVIESTSLNYAALPTNTAWAVSCWINNSDNTITSAPISLMGGINGWGLFLQSGNVQLATDGSTPVATTGAFATLANNTWMNVVISYDGSGTTTLYYDGSFGATVSFTFSAITSGNLKIGKAPYWSYFKGKIDQVRFFNKALSLNEVTTLYGETSASATKSTTDIFDDGSGVALYELEGNANDTGLYGRGAIDSGQSAVFNRTGNGNTTSSAIYLPNNSFNSVTSYSLSAWVNMPNFANNGCAVFSNYFYNGSNEFGYKIYTNTSGNLVIDNWSPSLTRITSGSSLSVNTWHNIVITNTQSQIKIYIDGVLDSTNSTSGYAIDTTMFYTIGGAQYNNLIYDGFNGKIDQVRIYSSILSASDVEALVSETSVPTANLVAHYKLDGNGNDETTNYNATSVNNVTYSDPAEFPTYDGTATNVSYGYDGTPTNVSFVGTSFEPDFVWVKSRDVSVNAHVLQDSIRGVGQSKTLHSNVTVSEGTYGNYGFISSFDSNGFGVSVGSTSAEHTNYSGENYVAWCWKAGGTAVSNTQGTTTSTVIANQDAGFSIVKYTGGGDVNVGHGLSSAPELIISKITNASGSWVVYNSISGTGKYLFLDSTASIGTASEVFSAVTDTTFTHNWSGNSYSYINYCFHSVDGYQKVGSYTGNGTSGHQITGLGFAPRFVMIKKTSDTGSWFMFDSLRTTGNYSDQLQADSSAAEATGTYVDFISDGFQLDTTASDLNTSSQTFIYLAIA